MVKLWTPRNPEFAPSFALGLLCCVLGVVLLLELLIIQRSRSGGAALTGPVAQDSSPAKIEPDAAFALPPVEEFSAIVDRPLFIEGRKPPVEDDPSQATAEEDLTPLALSLMGVMLSPRGQMAILAEASGKNRRVKLGGTIGGWRLIDLKPDRVTLQRGEERRDLPLMKPKPKGPAAHLQQSGRRNLPNGPPPGARQAMRPPLPEPQPPTELIDPDGEEADDAPDSEDPGAPEDE